MDDQASSAVIAKTVTRSISNLWSFFVFEGIIMVAFGIIAVVLPPIAGLVVTILLGWLLIVSGLIGLFTTLMSRHAPGFWWSFLSAIVTVVAGSTLYSWPLGGVMALSLALAAYLTLDGALSIAMALDHRRHFTAKWILLFVNGAIDLVFAAVIIWWLPQSVAWALGLIIGIDMIIGGTTLIVIGIDAHKEEFASSDS